MREIPLTQGKVALVDDEDYEYLNQWKWYAQRTENNLWYAVRARWENQKRGKFFMHRVILDKALKPETDHINGNGLDNRRCNLRYATRSENAYNFLLNKTGKSSPFRGVSWHKRRQKWDSRITVKGKAIWLGSFLTEDEAYKMYQIASGFFFGEFTNDVVVS